MALSTRSPNLRWPLLSRISTHIFGLRPKTLNIFSLAAAVVANSSSKVTAVTVSAIYKRRRTRYCCRRLEVAVLAVYNLALTTAVSNYISMMLPVTVGVGLVTKYTPRVRFPS